MCFAAHAMLLMLAPPQLDRLNLIPVVLFIYLIIFSYYFLFSYLTPLILSSFFI
jgi:hypothetical protein